MNPADQKRTWRISVRLKEARASAKEKLSQAELARRVQARGVEKFPAGVASRIELGYTYATWQEVEALAAVLGVNPKWLAGIKENPPAVDTQVGAGMAAKHKAALAAEGPSSSPPPPPVTAAKPATAPLAQPASEDRPPVIIAVVQPTRELPPLPIPPRGDMSALDYRTKLGQERRKTEELMAKSGPTPAEWRQQREYHRALTELLRTLVA